MSGHWSMWFRHNSVLLDHKTKMTISLVRDVTPTPCSHLWGVPYYYYYFYKLESQLDCAIILTNVCLKHFRGQESHDNSDKWSHQSQMKKMSCVEINWHAQEAYNSERKQTLTPGLWTSCLLHSPSMLYQEGPLWLSRGGTGCFRNFLSIHLCQLLDSFLFF